MENTLHKQLVEIQQKLKAPKNQKNTFGNYNYRSCEDILEAVKPLLNGIALILEDEVVNVGTKNYIKATAFLSNGKDIIHASAYAREAEDKKGMDDAQITGAASSYARKYALNGLFAIDDTKDADTQDNTHHEVKKPAETYSRVSSEHFCTLHQRDLKLRDGDYYDHRLQIDGVWNRCEGQGWTTEQHKTEYEKKVESEPKQEEPPLEDPEWMNG